MIFFIATIFIAQIIILWNIVNFLVSIDNKVNVLAKKVDGYSDILPELLSTVREITFDTNKMIVLLREKFVKEKNKFVMNECRSVIESLALVMLKPKYKKLLVGLKLGAKLTKKLIKAKNML